MLPRRLQWMSIRNSYSLRYLGVHSIWPQMTAMQDEAAAIEAITKQLAYSSPLAFATLREPLQTPVWFSSYSIISSTQRWYLLAADANSSGTHACRPWKTRTEYNIFTSIFAANLSIEDVRQDLACIEVLIPQHTLHTLFQHAIDVLELGLVLPLIIHNDMS